MEMKTIPGTVLPCQPPMGSDTFAAVASLCSVTGGLSLSQIVGFTGLEASTIQNWVKRGWVSRPTGKKYNERQIARILLINVLRDCLPLEKIAQLLGAVNGSVEDAADDIIDEGELYNRFCAILSDQIDRTTPPEEIRIAVNRHLADYTGPKLDSKACLARALEIMVLAFQASRMKQLVESRLTEWLTEVSD